jgi:M6 family metalloprotease-like protein
MRKFQKASLLLSTTLILCLISPPTPASAIAGTKCVKVGNTKTVKGISYSCVKKGKKLFWVKKITIKPATKEPTPETTITPEIPQAPVRLQFEIAVYSGSAGQSGNQSLIKSDEIPSSISYRTTTDNFKLWIYDPENPSRALGAPGVWFQKLGGDWKYTSAATSDGTFSTDLSPGSYTFDVVEPNNDQKKYSRGRYTVVVGSNKSVIVEGLAPNSADYYSVSVTLNNRRLKEVSSFLPTSVCQLKDQSGSPTMSNAFPRATGRLVNNGNIRALIIPVSFTDLPGNGEPSQVYRSMAEGTHNYFYKQSQGRVSFQFTTLKSYLNLNVPVKNFNLGSYNGGDPTGLFTAGLAAADPIVDFSKFDVVYVLPPSSVASNQIAYGPAFPNNVDGKEFFTQDGRVMNGSVGGADAWQNLEGAGWKWMSHETGHLFGLFDWYTLDKTIPYGPWDIMSLNWSTEAIELNAWNRYISGWLDDSQIHCLEKVSLDVAPREFIVEVLGVDSKKVKAAMVKLSDSKILVLEVRATAGLDKVAPANSGLLIYTVDVSIATIMGIAKTHSRPSVSKTLIDAPLKVGETLTIDGVKVTVSGFENNEIKFSLSR